MQPWCLVSPASKGIGFELARLLLQRTNVPVVATARKDIDQTKQSLLQGLEEDVKGRLNVLQLDVTGPDPTKLHNIQINPSLTKRKMRNL